MQGIDSQKKTIDGGLAGYLSRFIQRIQEASGTVRIRAFIRLTSYDDKRLTRDPMLEEFYARLEEFAKSGNMVIDYMLLLNQQTELEAIRSYLEDLQRFAARISYLHEGDSRLKPETVASNIVLFSNQGVAFTHDRDAQCEFSGATEWSSSEVVHQLQKQYNTIECVSRVAHESLYRASLISKLGSGNG